MLGKTRSSLVLLSASGDRIANTDLVGGGVWAGALTS
jgi:hypothetical protein